MSAATNQAQFSNSIKDWSRKLRMNAGKLQRKITFDLHRDIVKFTPVKTGRARSNWFASVGAPSTEVNAHEGVTAENSISAPAPADLAAIDGTQDSYVINNLVYIKALEEGHSDQAPAGMVKLAIQAQNARLASAGGENELLARG